MADLAAGKSTGRRSPLIKPGSEDEIQATFFEWIDLYKEQKGFYRLQACYAIPNVGSYARAQNAKLKLTGRRPGVPDVHLPVESADGLDGGLWIEFKKPGEKPTAVQLEWHQRLRNLGHRVKVCTSWTDAANIVIEYLGLLLEKL